MSTSVLIYSCDKYSDVWEPFFTLFFRYWECPYRVYISSETKKCRVPGVTTLNVNGEWSDLIRQALEQIAQALHKDVFGLVADDAHAGLAEDRYVL